MVLIPQLIGALLCTAVSALPQGPNTLAQNNPNVRTQAVNGTWFIIPVNVTTVQNAIQYPLLPVPTDDNTLFPNGFPTGKHPILVSSYYGSDIRLAGLLQIESLFGAAVYAPFIDRLGDGKTPFQMPLINLVGGVDGQDIAPLVPSLVGTLTSGQAVSEGQFTPNDAAYEALTPTEYLAQVKLTIVPNPVSGPGVIESVFELDFTTATNPYFTAHTIHAAINQPQILNNGQCARNEVLFNETFSDPVLRDGKVTLYTPPLPTGFQGVYQGEGVGGYSGQGENVGFNPEDCATSAMNVDPAATA